MARYVSIRGWLESDSDDVIQMKKITDNYLVNWEELGITQEVRDLYQSGWRFPESEINWTAYVFYGADIKSYYLNFIKEQIQEIALINKEISGLFYVDDEESEKQIYWKIEGGKIMEGSREE